MQNRVYEMMTKRQVVGWTVRVWMKVDGLVSNQPANYPENARQAFGPSAPVLMALNNAIQTHGVAINQAQIAAALEPLMPAAYEIVDKYGFGVVVYPDWH